MHLVVSSESHDLSSFCALVNSTADGYSMRTTFILTSELLTLFHSVQTDIFTKVVCFMVSTTLTLSKF